MRTQRIHPTRFILFLGLLSLTVGCGRKCQAPLAQAPTSLTQQEWRMVPMGTTDPQIKKYLTNYNFETYSFGQFEGFKKVFLSNQAEDEESAKKNNRFIYVLLGKNVLCVDEAPGASTIRATQSQADLATRCRAPSGNVKVYRYQLNRDGLTLTESTTGYVKRFVAYEGAIAPDNFCEF